MIDKILVKITGITLVVLSITLTVLLFLFSESDYDLVVLASYVFLITMIVITLILGIAFITAKVNKKTTIEVVEDDRDDEVEEDE